MTDPTTSPEGRESGGLDTSGSVSYRVHGIVQTKIWSDFKPFTQGYIAAAMYEASVLAANVHDDDRIPSPGFSDLAPETLVRIVEDCSSAQNIFSGLGFKTGAKEGRYFWIGQSSGQLTGAWSAAFPPQTVTLGDDGKVYLS